MTPLIRRTLPVILFLALAVLAPLPASAKEIRHPETGLPAYVFTLPDEWTTQPAEQGNLILLSPTRTAVLVILLAKSNEPLDKIAKEGLETAPAVPDGRKEPVEISGCAGFTWYGTMKNAKDLTLNLEMSIVRVDSDHVASASLILTPDIDAADESTARLVRSGLTLEGATATDDNEPLPLPNPLLELNGLEYYRSGGKEFTRYKYSVENRADFPDVLFAPAPELPPCGSNTKASRTWVDFFDESGKRLNGFCALGKHDDLNEIWFAVETTVAPPDLVYIELNDRKTSTTYRSNLAPTTKGPRGPASGSGQP